jgi:signal peptidase I
MHGVVSLLIMLLSYLALPVVLIYLYDKFVLAPERARQVVPVVSAQMKAATPGADATLPAGPQAPMYVRAAGTLLPFVLVAVVLQIGAAEVFAWIKQIAVPLSWFALPLGLWCAVDSWLFAPRRQVKAGDADVRDPPLVRAAYTILPVLVVAVIVRMISAESLDFSLVLFVLSVATGAVWGIDQLFFRKPREAAAATHAPPMALREPGTVDYARSFFPVAAIVLLVRAFIFEPFRIPSDSMMPTLLDGDFIVVNKYAYGLRLPVLNTKFISTGEPQRGDVVVFRWPPNPSVNFIKRLVGLPGDRVEVRNDQIIINGEPIPQQADGSFNDGCYVGVRLMNETIGEHKHQVMVCHSFDALEHSRDLVSLGDGTPLPKCDRKKVDHDAGNYVCNENISGGALDSGDTRAPIVVPAGQYLMIGDNRDNSDDGRRWGFVPDENLVGKATRIWFNFDLERPGPKVVNWGRIGDSIK